MTSVVAFKNYLNRNKLKSPYYFHVGSRLGQILHARHILIICPAYAATRSYLPDNLHEYSLKDLLYVNEHGTVYENETLFL